MYEDAKLDFPNADEVILWNQNGEITEGCISNVVIKQSNQWITPPIESGLLAGTFRAHLLKTGKISEKKISIDELLAADEIFLINSLRKWQRAQFMKADTLK